MYNKELDIYTTKFLGTVTKKTLVELLNSTVGKASDHNCNNILFDMRESKFQLSFLDEHILHKEMLARTDLTNDHRIAVIHTFIEDEGKVDYSSEKISKKRTEYADVVGEYWGQKIWNFFSDYDEGVRWLTQDT